VLVTGAGRGVGRAVARRLAAAGADVVLVSRKADQIQQVRAAVEALGGRALAIVADVSRAGDVQRVMDETQATFGRLDVLVNNAGFVHVSTLEDLQPEAFEHMLDANVRAVYLCTRAAWPELVRSRGAVVNISSMSAYDPFPGLAVYGATKAFVNLLTQGLAAEGAAAGVRVYGIAPGAVETDMLRDAFPDFPAEKALAPDDVAVLVESLLGTAGRHVSGQTVVVRK
jgi:NAD(P)-dependent dehydrogenase (short-subunit alcohol dehydrogenase family)